MTTFAGTARSQEAERSQTTPVVGGAAAPRPGCDPGATFEDALWARCMELVDRGDWAQSLAAFQEAATLVVEPAWKGSFLDGAVYATEHLGGLGGPHATRLVEESWRAAP